MEPLEDAAAELASLSVLPLPPASLLRLPAEMLAAILEYLSPADACRAAFTCLAISEVALSDAAWSARLRRHFPDVPPPPSSVRPLEHFRRLTAGRTTIPIGRRSCPLRCGGTLHGPRGGRCPCVAARTTRLPLALGGLAAWRSGSSALSRSGEPTSPGFSEMVGALDERFDLAPLAELDEACMHGMACMARQGRACMAWQGMHGM